MLGDTDGPAREEAERVATAETAAAAGDHGQQRARSSGRRL